MAARSTETVPSSGATGWLIAPDDPAAWAAAMIRAIDLGPGKRGEMGLTGIYRTRQLSRVDAMCAAPLAAYERVLETWHA